MSFTCTLPKPNGKPCGKTINGMTGLMELNNLRKHINRHTHLVVNTDALTARVMMEDGEVPPYTIIP